MNTRYKLGCHIGIQKTIEDTIKSVIQLDLNSLQFFLGSPKSYKRKDITDDDLTISRELIDEFKLNVFSHLPYIYNFCGSVKKKKLAWDGDSEVDTLLTLIIKNVEYELGVLEKLNGACVLHPGFFKDRKNGIQTISKTINKIKFPSGSKLLLENMAGEGNELGTTLDELRKIYEGVENSGNLGFCIDTCHLFGYGTYDIREPSGIDKFYDDFENEFGIEKLGLIHLNDSKDPFGSRKDHHENITMGHIWKRSNLTYFLKKFEGIPKVLETCDVSITHLID